MPECEQCGADLEFGVPHECPVGGNIVLIEPIDGSERFTAKRSAGMSDVRFDGSCYSADTDRDAFAAEVFAATAFGKTASEEIFDGHGDEGYDFALLIDVYWIGRNIDGTPRRDGHLIKNPYQRVWADRYVVVSGTQEEGFRFEGWCTADELRAEPLQNFGYGPKHAIHISKLRGRRDG